MRISEERASQAKRIACAKALFLWEGARQIQKKSERTCVTGGDVRKVTTGGLEWANSYLAR